MNTHVECNADLGHPCDSNDGEPCESCVAEEEYWLNWARGQNFTRYSDEDLRDCYSDPTDAAKLESLLSRSS